MASFYSDWFLRYTSITRATATKTHEGDKEDAEPASSSNTESKENRGKKDSCVNILHINSTECLFQIPTCCWRQLLVMALYNSTG